MLRSLRAFFLLCHVTLAYALQWALSRCWRSARVEARWNTVHEVNAARLAQGFGRLGGVFIKFGQVLSVMGGFLPDAYRRHLDVLLDQAPPRSFDKIRCRLLEELGPDGLDRFRVFEPKAIAAASLAQVHRAELPDGTEVAVKVLYPGIEDLIRRDLFVLGLFVPVLKLAYPLSTMHRVLDQLRAMLERETDYHNEARNIELVRNMFSSRKDVVVPHVVPELSTQRVLTMSFENGTKLTTPQALESAGIDPEQAAHLVTECYLEMLFQHQLFHADPHPGNLLVRPGPSLVLLDFGAVEKLSDSLAKGMRTAVLGALSRDADKVLEGAEQMGFIAPDGDRELLREAGRKYLHALAQLRIDNYDQLDPHQLRAASGRTLSGARALLRHVEYPHGYFYVERTLGLLFGLVGRLAPRKGLPGIAAPIASKLMLRSLARARPEPPLQARGVDR